MAHIWSAWNSLVRKSQVRSEYGEPLTWEKEGVLSTADVYRLCRCGQSKTKPFCDGTHTLVEFDGFENADTGPISGVRGPSAAPSYRSWTISICVHSGFRDNRITNIWEMVGQSDDTQVRAQIMAMIERCPSGTLAYTLEPGGKS